MPFVTITLHERNDPTFIKTLSEIIHLAMVETILFPHEVLYHTIHEVKPGNMIYSNNHKGLTRSEDIIFLQITLKEGRDVEQKNAMYQRITDDLDLQLGIRKEDIMIILTENKSTDWFFGSASESPNP